MAAWHTCPKVDDNINEKDGVGQTVEYDPAVGEVVVEERDGHGQDHQVRHQQQQHTKIPIKPEIINDYYHIFKYFETGPHRVVLKKLHMASTVVMSVTLIVRVGECLGPK